MSEQSPYDQLGVSDASTFEEIKAARDRLYALYDGDQRQLEAIEAAYDAVLMDRLRQRKQGKIKVPDRIRFPEKTTQPTPAASAPDTRLAASSWRRFLDKPSRADVLLPGAILTGLSALVLFMPSPETLQMALVAGVGAGFYFLYRKEKKFGRSVLLGLLGLIVGLLVGGTLASLLQPQLAPFAITTEAIATVITFFILWLISSFLR
jgi:hypothetical protein